MKKVSVIIPVYNSSKYLKECIDSVLNQSYKNLEVIIIDDKSSDNSLDIINSYKDKRIKLISLDKNSGVSVARNIGIDKSSGDYITFIDSDDYWDLDKIKKQVDFIEKNNYVFIYSDYRFLKNNKFHNVHVPKSIVYKEALGNTTIFTSTVMFNMKYLDKKDIYMPLVKRGQDSLCWWRVLKSGITAYGMNDVLATYRVGDSSLSSNKIIALKRTWNLYKLENISFFKRMYYFICYVMNAIKRRI